MVHHLVWLKRAAGTRQISVIMKGESLGGRGGGVE